MIGQKNLLEVINRQLEQNVFPRFSIISGWEHSGKTTLALEIAKSLCYYPTVIDDVSIENIRNVIETAYSTVDSQVFIIRNIDTMSVSAKNSMLKVLEEPPQRAYFILTCNNLETLLPTIRSRATVYVMENYTQKELQEYAESKSAKNIPTIIGLANSPAEVNILMRMDIDEVFDFVDLVIDNITTASLSNVLKIGRKIALKKDSEGIDLGFFWRRFAQRCFERSLTQIHPYAKWGHITMHKFTELCKTPSINKTSLFDTWILDIRGATE